MTLPKTELTVHMFASYECAFVGVKNFVKPIQTLLKNIQKLLFVLLHLSLGYKIWLTEKLIENRGTHFLVSIWFDVKVFRTFPTNSKEETWI